MSKDKNRQNVSSTQVETQVEGSTAEAVAAPPVVETKVEESKPVGYTEPVVTNPLDAKIKELDEQIAALTSSNIPQIAKDAGLDALEKSKKNLVDNREELAKKYAEIEANDDLSEKGKTKAKDEALANLGRPVETSERGGGGPKDRFGCKSNAQSGSINKVLETATSEALAVTVKQIAEKTKLSESRINGHLKHWYGNREGLGKFLVKVEKDGSTKYHLKG